MIDRLGSRITDRISLNCIHDDSHGSAFLHAARYEHTKKGKNKKTVQTMQHIAHNLDRTDKIFHLSSCIKAAWAASDEGVCYPCFPQVLPWLSFSFLFFALTSEALFLP